MFANQLATLLTKKSVVQLRSLGHFGLQITAAECGTAPPNRRAGQLPWCRHAVTKPLKSGCGLFGFD